MYLFKVPRVLSDQFNVFQDIDRLQHYNQLIGGAATQDIDYQGQNQFNINPAAFFSEDTENNTAFLLGLYAKEKSYEEYRKTGVHR